MKKYTTTILIAVVALAAGYFAGAKFGMGDANAAQTSGDINVVNKYQQIISEPDYMAFNEEFANDTAAIKRTIDALEIIDKRISEFGTLGHLMNTVTFTEKDMKDAAKKFIEADKQCLENRKEASLALAAARKMQSGEKVDLKKAEEQANTAYNTLDKQLKAGKEFVEKADIFLKDKKVEAHIMLATLRDMVASHCAVNASLTQNEREQDYWMNLSELLVDEQMAFGE